MIQGTRKRIYFTFIIIIISIALIGCSAEQTIIREMKSDPEVQDVSFEVNSNEVNIQIFLKNKLTGKKAIALAQKYAEKTNENKAFDNKDINVYVHYKDQVIGGFMIPYYE